MCLFAAAVAQTLDWIHNEGLSGGSDWQDGMCLAPVRRKRLIVLLQAWELWDLYSIAGGKHFAF